MFFRQNWFEHDIVDYELMPRREHWFWNKVPRGNMFVFDAGVCRWENLLKWLKMYHAGFDNVYERTFEWWEAVQWGDETINACCCAFRIVDYLRDQPWEAVEIGLGICCANERIWL